MKKFIQVNCPHCERQQRVKFNLGLQIVTCDPKGIGCARRFALDVSLEIEESESSTVYFYEGEIFKLVSVLKNPKKTTTGLIRRSSLPASHMPGIGETAKMVIEVLKRI